MTKEILHRNALLKGSRLNEYIIEKVLGKPGGFGIAYLAKDTNLDQLVAIKEYLPNDLAMREGTTVQPKSTHDEEEFEWGLERFLDEAKTLARFNHPNVVQVLRYFTANSTAYMVMRYEDGLPLNEILEKKTLTEDELLQNILLPLLDGLKQVHAADFLHRDIKSGNIYMRRSDEMPMLLDFGAARNALGSKSKSLTSIVTAGYAPFEQYHSDGNQGSWSDIYALGAVAYRVVTGSRPPEALSRIRKDKMIPAVEAAQGKYSKSLLQAIDHALAMDEEDRPQSCEEWKRELTAETITADPEKKKPEQASKAAELKVKTLERYVVHGDGTVTDNTTGLMWKQYSERSNGSSRKAGSVKKHDWKGALQQAETLNNSSGFATYTDWRVPTIEELKSIVEKQNRPTINKEIFPDTVDYPYWSASPFAGDADYAWAVGFGNGNDGADGKTGNAYVRLVRGGQ